LSVCSLMMPAQHIQASRVRAALFKIDQYFGSFFYFGFARFMSTPTVSPPLMIGATTSQPSEPSSLRRFTIVSDPEL
jgi:hypothetical protein